MPNSSRAFSAPCRTEFQNEACEALGIMTTTGRLVLRSAESSGLLGDDAEAAASPDLAPARGSSLAHPGHVAAATRTANNDAQRRSLTDRSRLVEKSDPILYRESTRPPHRCLSGATAVVRMAV